MAGHSVGRRVCDKLIAEVTKPPPHGDHGEEDHHDDHVDEDDRSGGHLSGGGEMGDAAIFWR